jgi:hypothetical protein
MHAGVLFLIRVQAQGILLPCRNWLVQGEGCLVRKRQPHTCQSVPRLLPPVFCCHIRCG